MLTEDHSKIAGLVLLWAEIEKANDAARVNAFQVLLEASLADELYDVTSTATLGFRI